MNVQPISEYLRHVLTLLGGTVAVQLGLVAATPVLTRLYSPAEFGTFALFVAVSTILGMVACGRFELAVMLPREEREAISVFQLGFLFSIGISTVLLLFTGICAIIPALDLDNQQRLILFSLPLAVFLQGVTQNAGALLNRHSQYKQISLGRSANVLGVVGISIILGLSGFGAIGLVAGKVAGHVLELMVLLWVLSKNRMPFTNVQLPAVKAAFFKYSSFLKYSTLEAILNSVFRQIPVFALTTFFSATAAGFYSIAQTVVAKPAGMIAGAFGQVFYQRAVEAEAVSGDALADLFKSTCQLLSILAVAGVLIVVLPGPALFAWVLGSEWREAGIYAAWSMPFVAVSFVKSPLSCMIDIKNRIRENLVFELAFLLVSAISFLIAIRFQDSLLGVQLFSFTNAGLGICQLVWYNRLLKKPAQF